MSNNITTAARLLIPASMFGALSAAAGLALSHAYEVPGVDHFYLYSGVFMYWISGMALGISGAILLRNDKRSLDR